MEDLNYFIAIFISQINIRKTLQTSYFPYHLMQSLSNKFSGQIIA